MKWNSYILINIVGCRGVVQPLQLGGLVPGNLNEIIIRSSICKLLLNSHKGFVATINKSYLHIVPSCRLICFQNVMYILHKWDLNLGPSKQSYLKLDWLINQSANPTKLFAQVCINFACGLLSWKLSKYFWTASSTTLKKIWVGILFLIFLLLL